MLSSIDVPPMAGLLVRCEHLPVSEDLRQRVEQRCEALQAQGLVRQVLIECQSSTELPFVLRTVATAMEDHLHQPANWLLPDFGELWARTVRKQGDLLEAESVRAALPKATRTYDVVLLRRLLRQAFELCLPEEEYAASFRLLLDLQQTSFVQAKEQELSRHLTAASRSAVSQNLAEQMQVLSPEGAEPEGRPPRLLSVLSEIENHSSLADFVGLKDSATLKSMSRPWSALKFSLVPIKMALTKVPSEAEPMAVLLFQNILRRMGDLPDASRSDRDQPILDVLEIQELHDEVYVQIIKQLTDNPSTRSSQAGWALLKRVVQKRGPSFGLHDILCNFLTGIIDGKAVDPSDLEKVGRKDSRGSFRSVSKRTSAQFYAHERPKLAWEILAKLRPPAIEEERFADDTASWTVRVGSSFLSAAGVSQDERL